MGFNGCYLTPDSKILREIPYLRSGFAILLAERRTVDISEHVMSNLSFERLQPCLILQKNLRACLNGANRQLHSVEDFLYNPVDSQCMISGANENRRPELSMFLSDLASDFGTWSHELKRLSMEVIQNDAFPGKHLQTHMNVARQFAALSDRFASMFDPVDNQLPTIATDDEILGQIPQNPQNGLNLHEFWHNALF